MLRNFQDFKQFLASFLLLPVSAPILLPVSAPSSIVHNCAKNSCGEIWLQWTQNWKSKIFYSEFNQTFLQLLFQRWRLLSKLLNFYTIFNVRPLATGLLIKNVFGNHRKVSLDLYTNSKFRKVIDLWNKEMIESKIDWNKKMIDSNSNREVYFVSAKYQSESENTSLWYR